MAEQSSSQRELDGIEWMRFLGANVVHNFTQPGSARWRHRNVFSVIDVWEGNPMLTCRRSPLDSLHKESVVQKIDIFIVQLSIKYLYKNNQSQDVRG